MERKTPHILDPYFAWLIFFTLVGPITIGLLLGELGIRNMLAEHFTRATSLFRWGHITILWGTGLSFGATLIVGLLRGGELHNCARTGQTHHVVTLLKRYNKTKLWAARPNPRTILGTTPLHIAATYNDCDVAALLLNAGASVDARDMWGETALHKAMKADHASIAQFLIEHGANPEAVNKRNKTPREVGPPNSPIT